VLTNASDDLTYPWATPPAPGTATSVAPGVKWLRMPLPFKLHHIVVLPFDSKTAYGGSGARAFPIRPTEAFLEPLTALALVAATTRRVRLGTTVLVLPHRHPVLAAKTVATLDYLSEGRVILGAAVGRWREEIEALGAPFARRGAWSDEALAVMKRCWTDERSAHAGEFFTFDAVGCFPKPRQRPYPPLWIGGRTATAYRRAARFGDGFHAA
jgi:probable F420-dependent oxidoreductase